MITRRGTSSWTIEFCSCRWLAGIASYQKANTKRLGISSLQSTLSRPLVPIKETVIGCDLSLRLPPIHGLVNGVEASLWSKKAWTCKEGLISRRRLALIKRYFSYVWTCLQKSCTEPPDSTSQLILYNSSPANRQYLTIPTLKEFLSRDITYVSDGLSAFKGLGRQIQASSQAEFFWGLPEYESHKAFLWQVPDPQTSSPPCPDFPSWAWGGRFKAPYYVDTPNLADVRPLEESRHI